MFSDVFSLIFQTLCSPRGSVTAAKAAKRLCAERTTLRNRAQVPVRARSVREGCDKMLAPVRVPLCAAYCALAGAVRGCRFSAGCAPLRVLACGYARSRAPHVAACAANACKFRAKWMLSITYPHGEQSDSKKALHTALHYTTTHLSTHLNQFLEFVGTKTSP